MLPDSRRIYPQGELAGAGDRHGRDREPGPDRARGVRGRAPPRHRRRARGDPRRARRRARARHGRGRRRPAPTCSSRSTPASRPRPSACWPRSARPTAPTARRRSSWTRAPREVLAMANWPGVDPSDPGERRRREVLANMATGFTYEPGSTFKAFTVAGALEEGLVTPTTTFDLPPTIQVADRVIEEAHEGVGYGTLSVADILASLSNVGAVKIGLELGAERLRQVDPPVRLRRADRGRTSPARSGGSCSTVDEYSGSTMGNLPIGQGLSVTPMQMAAGYAAIANGGVLRAAAADPRRGRRAGRGRRGRAGDQPRRPRGELREMLEGVLAPGRHRRRRSSVPGYTLAGKTGTAQKVVRDRRPTRRPSSSPRSSASPRPRTRSCWSRSSSTTRRATTTAARSPRPPSARSPASRCRTCGIPPAVARLARPRIAAMELRELLAGADVRRDRRRRRDRDHRPRLRQPRRPGPGRCSSRPRAARPTGTSSRRSRSQAGATARGRRAARSSCEPFVVQALVGDARAAMAHAAVRFYGDPTRRARAWSGSPAPTARRRPPSWSATSSSAAGVQTGLLGTVKRVVGGVDERGRAHDAGGDRPAAHVPPDGRRRRPRLRDGGLLARAQPQPRRRDPLRGRRLHQPDPGPPRLPRRHGGLLPRQAPAVRSGEPRPSALVVNVDDPYGDKLAAEFERGHLLGRRRRARRPARARASPSTPPARASGSPPPTASVEVGAAAARALQRRERALRDRLRAGARDRPRRRGRRARRRRARAGPVRAGRRGPAVRRPRRLRAHARLARERARLGAADHRRRTGG